MLRGIGKSTRWHEKIRSTVALLLAFCSSCVALAGSPAEAIAASHAALQMVPVGSQKYTRYLYFGMCEEGKELNGKQKQQLWQLLSAHCNGMSLKRSVWPLPVIIADEKGNLSEHGGFVLKPEQWDRVILARVDLERYGWKTETWELLVKVEPYLRYQPPDLTGKITNVKIVEKEVIPPVVDPRANEIVFVERGGFLREVKRSEARAAEQIYIRQPGGGLALDIGPRPQKQAEVKQEEKKVERKDAVRAIWVDEKQEADLIKGTGSSVPVVYGDFFYWQTSVQAEREPGPGYLDFLQIKNEADFQRRGGFDPKIFKEQFEEFVREYREAVKHSGVARQPRRVASFKTLGGWGFITFDSRKAVGNKNPLDTPNDAFDYEATEQLFNGANGILVMGLFAKGGVKQDVAPDFVGHDKTTTDNDGRIQVGQCFRCHDNGLKTFKGYYKNVYRGKVSVEGPDGKEIYKLQDEYFERIEESIDAGRKIHEQAIMKACGLSLKKYSEAISEQWSLYVGTNPVIEGKGFTLKRVAARIGCKPEDIVAAIKGLKLKQPGKPVPLQGLRVWDSLLVDEKDQEPIPVDALHETIGELMILMQGVKK